MKSICMLLLPVSVLATVLVLAAALWAHGALSPAHVMGHDPWPAGGMSAVEVEELVE